MIVRRLSKNHYPTGLVAVGRTLYFAAYDRLHGQELWKSDGTDSGTVMVKDILEGPDGSWPDRFTGVGDFVYFLASDPYWGSPHRAGLWRSDGSRAGTVQLGTVRAAANAYELVGAGDTLYFVTRTPRYGDELWKSDGTEAGTVIVKDLVPGSEGSDPFGLTDVGGTLWFVADDGTHGHELWTSDGSDAGTFMVRDIWPGADSSGPGEHADVGGSIFFHADDGVHGSELWTASS